ncbi:transposase [Flavobacterium sp.]|uniref:transposase n=1 Tax=Flavobacterium sp. TaxID=239 RepID=UPI0037505EDC
MRFNKNIIIPINNGKYDTLEADNFYHIFNRGNNKEDLFIEHENYLHFLKLIKTHLAPIASIFSYCLMKNHFHLVLKINSKEQLEQINVNLDKISQPFSNLFNAYTKSINKRYDREGSLFKVRFKRERINTEEYLKNVIIYTHLNPVKHNFQNDYSNYKYSSYQSLISEKPTLLMRNEVFELFSNKENFIYHHTEIFRKGYHEDFD